MSRNRDDRYKPHRIIEQEPDACHTIFMAAIGLGVFFSFIYGNMIPLAIATVALHFFFKFMSKVF